MHDFKFSKLKPYSYRLLWLITFIIFAAGLILYFYGREKRGKIEIPSPVESNSHLNLPLPMGASPTNTPLLLQNGIPAQSENNPTK